MNLLSISDDVLFEIFSDPDLTTNDLFHLIITCHRFHKLTIPILYRNIKQIYTKINRPPVLLPNDPNDVLEPKALRQLTFAFKTHPELAQWVQAAEFACNVRNFQALENIIALLHKFKALRVLKLFTNGSYCTYENPDGVPPKDGSMFVQLPAICSSLPFLPVLQSLTIDDDRITPDQVTKFYQIQSLRHFQVVALQKTAKSLSSPHPRGGHGYTTSLRKLEFQLSSWPIGAVVKDLISGHPELDDFTWVMSLYISDRVTKATSTSLSFSQTLAPLHETVQRLQLSIRNPAFLEGYPLGGHYDLSGFQVLKTVEIHHDLIFPRSIKVRGCDLGQKLPSSLENLKILSNGSSHLDMSSDHVVADYSWITALAYDKVTRLTRLREVTIIDRDSRVQYTPHPFSVAEALEAGGSEWAYPQDVLDAFKWACVRLLVLLRIAPDRTYWADLVEARERE